MLIAAVAFEVVAIALVVAAYASRTDPPSFEGQAGTIEELLNQFSTPAGPEFTSAGVALLTAAAVAAIAGSVLFVWTLRRR